MIPFAKIARLSIINLEDRLTPATANYLALTQTLTITAAQGDLIAVSAVTGEPTGYLKIMESQSGATVFDSNAGGRAVRNLVVKFDGVDSGGFTLNADARLGGNLAFFAAKSSQTFDLLGTVGGNVNYKGNILGAFDDIDFEASAVVGGNLVLALAGGSNTTRIKGGTIRGNLLITGNGSDDRVELGQSADITINGSATLHLGDGTNFVKAMGLAPVIRVQGNFSFVGGPGNDTFDLDGAGAALAVGTDARFTFGNGMLFDANSASFESLRAGRNIVFIGGIGNDTIDVTGALEAGGNVLANLGSGDNSFIENGQAAGAGAIGGSLTYIGGPYFDHVALDATRIGRQLTVNLGDNITTGQSLFVGLNNPAGVTVFGNVRVSGGAGADGMLFRRLYVGGSLNIATGAGEDTVTFDDTNVAGMTLVDLGAGNDLLQSELLTTDGGGSLSAATTFGGAFVVRGGDGNDTLHLSDDGNASTLIKFGTKTVFSGGNGNDTLGNGPDNVFKVPGSLNDFDTSIGTIVI